MTVTDITTEHTTRFAIGVKSSDRGRKVFHADTASCGVRELALEWAQNVADDNPELPVFVIDAKAGHGYRPAYLRMAHDSRYDGIGEDADVNLDELSDDQL